jgi:hypothetical protein
MSMYCKRRPSGAAAHARREVLDGKLAAVTTQRCEVLQRSVNRRFQDGKSVPNGRHTTRWTRPAPRAALRIPMALMAFEFSNFTRESSRAPRSRDRRASIECCVGILELDELLVPDQLVFGICPDRSRPVCNSVFGNAQRLATPAALLVVFASRSNQHHHRIHSCIRSAGGSARKFR